MTRSEAKTIFARTGIRRYRVLYMKGRREHCSPWFNCRNRAGKALDILRAKYGAAIIYTD